MTEDNYEYTRGDNTTFRLNDDQQRIVQALETREEGRSGNPALRDELGWDDDRYWRVHAQLVEEGVVAKGRGRGGSVSLVLTDEDEEESQQSSEASDQVISERIAETSLYDPIKNVLAGQWAKEKSYNDFVVQITGLQGGKRTGGTWTRPDLTVVAQRKFVFYPQRSFDLITFEVKPSDQLTITGVFEAMSHREFSTQSYVVYHASVRILEDCAEYDRIIGNAERMGIGVIAAENPGQFETWEEIVSPIRDQTDPNVIDRFIRQNFDESQRNEIISWRQ